MVSLVCLWIRPWLERYADRALGSRLARSVEGHLGRCAGCLGRVERQAQLRNLVKSALADPSDPDWTGFWPAVRTRVARETPHPIRDPWWIPLWKPFWGHPRLALGGLTAAALALVFLVWPVGEGNVPAAWAGPVVVQDVGTPDPDRSVMVYSTPDHALTVIWLFSLEAAVDES